MQAAVFCRSPLWTGQIGETELHLFAALIVVDGERSGEVERRIRLAQQGIANGAAGGAEGDGLEAGAIL